MAQTFTSPETPRRAATPTSFAWWVDVLLFLFIAGVTYGIVALAARSAAPLTEKVAIDLSWRSLPVYAAYSTMRMAIAYILSLVFSVTYARLAAASRTSERVMLPLLDILQSIPILSFMPGIVLGLVALFPSRNLGLELAAIILIFTSQAWNIAFGFHQSLITIPKELSEAGKLYRLSFWQRFTRLELPFGMIPLVWNSMMSWAGGWFFLMAAEQFTLGDKDFQLPGLGSYLRTAADAGNFSALLLGLITLVLVVVALDVMLWRPMVAWANRFKVELAEAATVPTSPVLTALRRSALLHELTNRVLAPVAGRIDRFFTGQAQPSGKLDGRISVDQAANSARAAQRIGIVVTALLGAVAVWGAIGVVHLLATMTAQDWGAVATGTAATFLRTTVALLIGVAWTVPAGVAIGMNPRLASRFQPLVQVVASIPATALFPAVLLVMLSLPGGLNLAAIALMLLGTQWYVLFNVIAGAQAIPTDLREAAAICKLTGWRRWRYLILPVIFPFLVTGMITATGGAWNASIVSEYVTFGNQTYQTVGLGAVIAGAANTANFPLLLAGTLTMAVVVVLINRLFWRRLYRLAEQRFRLD
jgi:NitT/TauT family transport system permease protein